MCFVIGYVATEASHIFNLPPTNPRPVKVVTPTLHTTSVNPECKHIIFFQCDSFYNQTIIVRLRQIVLGLASLKKRRIRYWPSICNTALPLGKRRRCCSNLQRPITHSSSLFKRHVIIFFCKNSYSTRNSWKVSRTSPSRIPGVSICPLCSTGYL